MKLSQIKFGLLSTLLFMVAHADNASAPAVSSNITASAAKAKASDKFNLDNVTKLTVDVLDSCWNNREDMNNQQLIANLLMTQPVIEDSYEAMWKTARLVYFIGNYGYGEANFVDTGRGVKLFDYGVSAAKKAQKLNPNGVEGYYWYTIDLGSYGLAKGILSSASGAKDGMQAADKAKAIDPSYENYGSYRVLGKYYQELPGIFGGDNDKALASLTVATTKAPDFKNNWVFLGQYYIARGKYSDALASCNRALSLPLADGKYEDKRYTKEAKECVTRAKDKLS